MFEVYLLSQKLRFFGGCREKERFICIIQKKVVPLQPKVALGLISNGVAVMHCFSDEYLADELLIELGYKKK